MLKMLAVIVVLVAAVCVIGFASKRAERAHAASAAPTETVSAVSLPSNEAALQRLGEAMADDGTYALPGQVEPAAVKSPQPPEQTRGKPIRRSLIATQSR